MYVCLYYVSQEEMKLCYDNLWETIVYKKKPWSLQDVLECMIKHWIAVFSEIFPSGSLNLLKELQYYFSRKHKSMYIFLYLLNSYTYHSVSVNLIYLQLKL